MKALALLKQSACTVALVMVASPLVAFIGFSVVIGAASREPLFFPLHELPGLYKELTPSLLLCACLFVVSLMGWSFLRKQGLRRTEIVAVSAICFGLFYSYHFLESLLVRSRFSATALLIGMLGLVAGVICGAVLPHCFVPACSGDG